MRSLLLKAPDEVVVEELPIPSLNQGDILVEMKVCGLCGTDLEKMHGQYTAARPVLGHEAVGVIVQAGSGVEGFKAGDRVFPHHHVPCYECYFCRNGSETMCPYYRASNLDPGGFSEYFRVPAWNVLHGGVLKLPDHIGFEEASFIEPTACCIRCLNRCQVTRDDTVLVVGAGPMGLTHLQLLILLGSKVLVSEVSKMRIKYAERLGASSVYDAVKTDVASKVKEETGGRGADLAIVASGNPKAIVQALNSVRKGGKVCLFGVPIKGSILNYDFSDVFNSEISIISSYAATEAETKAALKLIAEHKLNMASLVTHRFRLEEFEKAVETAKKQDCEKVIITP